VKHSQDYVTVAFDSNLQLIGLTNSVLSVLNAFFNMLTLLSSGL